MPAQLPSVATVLLPYENVSSDVSGTKSGPASKGDDWTDALEADFVRQYKELEARDGKIE